MRLCLQAFRHAHAHTPAPRKVGGRIYAARRAFSSTPMQRRPAAKKDEADDFEEDDGDVDPAEMERSLHAALKNSDIDLEASTRLQEQILGGANAVVSQATRAPKISISRSFWHEDEDDSDMITDERDEDEFDEDDIMSMAHGKLEEFREYREYARIAAWEMPLLSSE